MRTLFPLRSRRLSLRTFLAAKAESLEISKTTRMYVTAKHRWRACIVFNVHAVPIVHLHYCRCRAHTMYFRIAEFGAAYGRSVWSSRESHFNEVSLEDACRSCHITFPGRVLRTSIWTRLRSSSYGTTANLGPGSDKPAAGLPWPRLGRQAP